MGKERGRVSMVLCLAHVVILYVDEMNNNLDICNQLVLISGVILCLNIKGL